MNGHADVTALLNADTGNTVATYYYDAFGTITEETNGILPEGEKVNNPFRYSGYQYDEETELYYLNARMYDSKIARFLQEDTYRGQANDPLSLNLYTYCSNNPLIYWDPTGHVASNVTINGKKIGNAQVNNNVTTGNVRDLATALGGEVGYDPKTKIASMTLNGETIKYDTKTVKNGVGIDSNGNPFYVSKDGHIQTSVRDMAKIADVEDSIEWGTKKNTPYVNINTPKPSTSSSSNSYVPPAEKPSEPDYQPSKPTNDAGNNSNTGNTTPTVYIIPTPDDFVYTENYPDSAQAVIERTERTDIENKGIEKVDEYIKNKIYNVVYKDMCVDMYTIDDHSLLADYYYKKRKTQNDIDVWYVLSGAADLAIIVVTKGVIEGILSMYSPDPSVTGIVGTLGLENSKKLNSVERQIDYLESNAFEHFILYEVASERLVDKLVEYKEELVKIDYSDAYGDSAREFKQAMFDYVNEIIYINENYKESKTAIEKKLNSLK